MRPVNLLPARYRPRTGGSADSKTAYITLGALALVVLAVFGYVLAAKNVTSRNAEIAQTRERIATTESQAVTLKGFGDFAGVKEARLTAVKTLASERLDWERLFRELAHVLPSGVWLTNFSGSASPVDGGAETASTLLLTGCASSHEQIADVMVRLRELHVAEEVELTKTTAPEKEEEAAAGGAPATADTESGCGSYTTFDVTIVLAVALPATGPAQPVPARLGGGE